MQCCCLPTSYFSVLPTHPSFSEKIERNQLPSTGPPAEAINASCAVRSADTKMWQVGECRAVCVLKSESGLLVRYANKEFDSSFSCSSVQFKHKYE